MKESMTYANVHGDSKKSMIQWLKAVPLKSERTGSLGFNISNCTQQASYLISLSLNFLICKMRK